MDPRLVTWFIGVVLMNPIDELREVRRKLKPLIVLEYQLRQQVEALGVGVHQGDVSTAYVVPKERCTLNTDLLKRECPTVWREYSKTTEYLEITVR